MPASGAGRGSQAVYPLVLQALVAEHVRDILATADGAQRARHARRPWWSRNPGLPRGAANGAGLKAPAQTLIREGRSVPHLACGVCWLLDVVAGQHGQGGCLWLELLTSHAATCAPA
jgi:hypothetical protein